VLTQVPPQQPTGFPTLLGHLASSDLIHPLYVLPVKNDGSSLSNIYEPLSSLLPCDIHIVNLRAIPPNSITDRMTHAARSPRMALILHRTAVDCSFPLLQSVASCPAAGAKVVTSTVWVQLPMRYCDMFPKRLGIFSPNFTRLLYVPIYARLHIFIQLSQLWRSYAILSVTTQFTSYAQNVHLPKLTLGAWVVVKPRSYSSISCKVVITTFLRSSWSNYKY